MQEQKEQPEEREKKLLEKIKNDELAAVEALARQAHLQTQEAAMRAREEFYHQQQQAFAQQQQYFAQQQQTYAAQQDQHTGMGVGIGTEIGLAGAAMLRVGCILM